MHITHGRDDDDDDDDDGILITNKTTILCCGLHVADGMLLEVSETLHYWTAATDGWGIGILLGLRQRVDATTDGGSAVPSVSQSCCPYLDTSPDV